MLHKNDNKDNLWIDVKGGYNNDNNNMWLQVNSGRGKNEDIKTTHCLKKILNKVLPCCFTTNKN